MSGGSAPQRAWAMSSTLLAAIALSALGCEGKRAPAAPPPPSVNVVTAERRDVPIVHEYVGTLDGFVNVEIRARVAGFLQQVGYREGTFVQAGQLLFQIDPAQFQAALADADGALARARATLHNAQLTLRRARRLTEQGVSTRQDLDNAVASELQAAAAVKSAEAVLDQARLNLSYATIRSPISGIAGVAQVRVGNLVGQGQPTLLTTVSQVDPIRVRFAVPERDYLDYRRVHPEPTDLSRVEPPVQLLLANGTAYPSPGHLIFAGREINPSTGTITVDALFPNPERILRPGQYARIRAQAAVLEGAVLIPARAVRTLQSASVVAVVDASGTAHVRQLELGPMIDSQQVITRGVQPGETVVVDGFEKAHEGQKVKPVRIAQPRVTPALPGPGIGGSGSSQGGR
jgi:membrane fusion protein (multidrug efflux system)